MKTACIFSLDDNYVMPFKVFFYSLEATGSIPEDTPIYILHTSSLSTSSIRDLRIYLSSYHRKACFIDASDQIPQNLPISLTDHVSPATFYRLYVAKIIDSKITKAVYLDADMLALRSVKSLFTQEISGPIAASDHCRPHDGIRMWGSCGGSYFQAGVLIIPIARWIEEAITNKFSNILANDLPRIKLWDQDVLNIAFKDNWERLPVTYNACRDVRSTFLNDNYNLSLEPHIIHFDGPKKPWNSAGNDYYSLMWHKTYYNLFRSHHPSSLKLTEKITYYCKKRINPIFRLLSRILRRVQRELL